MADEAAPEYDGPVTGNIVDFHEGRATWAAIVVACPIDDVPGNHGPPAVGCLHLCVFPATKGVFHVFNITEGNGDNQWSPRAPGGSKVEAPTPAPVKSPAKDNKPDLVAVD